MMDSYFKLIPPSAVASPRARRAYTIAAIGTKFFVISIFSVAFWLASRNSSVPVAEDTATVIRFVLLAGALSFAALAVGMEVYWLKYDQSGGWKKTFWFVAMIIGLPFGVLAYFYAVYLPQAKPIEEQALSASNAN